MNGLTYNGKNYVGSNEFDEHSNIFADFVKV